LNPTYIVNPQTGTDIRTLSDFSFGTPRAAVILSVVTSTLNYLLI